MYKRQWLIFVVLLLFVIAVLVAVRRARMVIAVGVFLLGFLRPVLESPQLKPAFDNILPALFGALDGYFIGFARIVQYQSIVLLMSICALLVIVRLVQKPQALAPWLSMAALFIATGVLSHYEGVLVAIPAAYLLGVLCWRERARGRALLAAGRSVSAPAAVTAASRSAASTIASASAASFFCRFTNGLT